MFGKKGKKNEDTEKEVMEERGSRTAKRRLKVDGD